ncbi:hypothetical protein P9265_05195 [Schinkia azotoformans]|uniref:hypothetical protein n=1 Tax=Schinkia azotoformans TaxID=1454 RepID=UPI002E1FB04C|nr:hypothetical protein [Schinkia azotoformans]
MEYDEKGRYISGFELEQFTKNSLNKRLQWIREELNKMYRGEYTVKKVAKESNIISHQGLYNLEGGESGNPRKSTISQLANYYQIPLDCLYNENPVSFFLGKQYVNLQPNDLLNAFYKVDVIIKVQNPEGKNIIDKAILSNLDCREVDLEEFMEKIEMEAAWIKRRITKQNRIIKAISELTIIQQHEVNKED